MDAPPVARPLVVRRGARAAVHLPRGAFSYVRGTPAVCRAAVHQPQKGLRGLSQPRYWRHCLVLGAIVWTFIWRGERRACARAPTAVPRS